MKYNFFQKIQAVVIALRLKHCIKNLLVFMPIIFVGKLFQTDLFVRQVISFFIFTFISSSIYILNDVCDRKSDARHPLKSQRPFASGILSPEFGIFLFLLLSVAGICLDLFFSRENRSTMLLGIYILLNIVYSLGCKKYALLDVAILSAGFPIRILYGGAFTAIPVSNWLLLTIMAGSLFMSFGKRRNELRDFDNDYETRDVLKYYTISFLDKCINSSMTLSIAFYSLWCYSKEESGNYGYIGSVPLLFFILLIYSLIIEKNESDGDPVNVLQKDHCLQILSAAYGIYMGFLLY